MALQSNIQHTFDVPASFTSDQRLVLAELIMKKIRERCDNSLKSTGGIMPGYSAEYKNSLDFQNAGKSSAPNLQLSGDMLASMKLIRHSIGKITIGYTIDDDLAGQVEGNQIGSYGQPIGNPKKARPFLGLPASVLEVLITKTKVDTTKIASDKSSSAVSDILKGLGTKLGE